MRAEPIKIWQNSRIRSMRCVINGTDKIKEREMAA